MIAIDPMSGSFGEEQFQDKQFYRDLHKLYLGFSAVPSNSLIATGLWGCGPMSGDKKLKFFQQLLAAAHVGQNLEYHLQSKKDEEAFASFFQSLKESGCTVGKF